MELSSILAPRPEIAAPLHAQLELALREQIAGGRWAAGQPIPSERELMRLAGVSRATVRQAIGSLISQGLLRRAHGRGTFVARRRIEQPLQAVYSFAQQVAALGRALEDRLLQRQVVPATPDLALQLGLRAGEPLIYIQRLRVLEGTPLTLDNFYAPQRLCPALLDAEIGGSLYRLLERHGLPPLCSADTLEPALADRAAAALLRVPPGTPLMFVERVAYTHDDRPLHVGRNFVRGDMCRFRANLAQPPALELKPPGGWAGG